MIGIITYHSAYNFGSALQAYATEFAVNKLGFDAEIINYRMVEQKKYYGLFRLKYGFQNTRNDAIQLLVLPDRIKRKKNFEAFFSDDLHLSREYAEPDEVKEAWKDYELIISGSDQIWNKYSCELKRNDWEHMMPYLLDGFQGEKVSYASSIGSMTDDDLKKIKPILEKFSYISMRESSTAERMSAILQRDIKTVADPTFLLSRQDWVERMNLSKDNNEPYILYYSLAGMSQMSRRKDKLLRLARNCNKKLKIVTPSIFYPILDSDVETCVSFGPREFLQCLYNSDMMITDSYHGSILSINLGKEIYSICDNGIGDYRKSEVFHRFGLDGRVIKDIDDIEQMKNDRIPYDIVRGMVDEFRNESYEYLKLCL